MAKPTFNPSKPFTPIFDSTRAYSPINGLPIPSIQEEPGIVESGLRGLEQGATLGFGDETNAALSTLLDSLTGQNKQLGILEDYRKQRGESREAMEAAQKTHPYISGAANLVGGVVPALLTGGASLPEQGVVGAAKLGAAYGAIGGLGGSEADLTQDNNLGQATKDVASGAVAGGLLGGAVHTGAERFGDMLSKAGVKGAQALGAIVKTPTELPIIAEPMEALRQGIKGQKLFGVSAAEDIQNQYIKKSPELEKTINDIENQASGQKIETLLKAPPETDIRPWLKGYNTVSANVRQNLGFEPGAVSDLDKVKTLVRDFMMGNEETGALARQKGGMVAPADLDMLRQALADLSIKGDDSLKSRSGRLFVTKLLANLEHPSVRGSKMEFPEGFTPLKPLMEQTVPGIDKLNATISSIENAKESLPSLNDLMNIAKTGQSGTTSKAAFEEFFNKLPEGSVGDLKNQFIELSKGRDIANKIAAPGLSHGLLANTVRGTMLTGANATGLTMRWLYDSTPETLKTLATKIAEGGTAVTSKLSSMLVNAADKDNIGRNALFFAIQQNPEYRRILAHSTNEEIPK